MPNTIHTHADPITLTLTLSVDLGREEELHRAWEEYEPSPRPFHDEAILRAMELVGSFVDQGSIDIGGWEMAVDGGWVSLNRTVVERGPDGPF